MPEPGNSYRISSSPGSISKVPWQAPETTTPVDVGSMSDTNVLGPFPLNNKDRKFLPFKEFLNCAKGRSRKFPEYFLKHKYYEVCFDQHRVRRHDPVPQPRFFP